MDSLIHLRAISQDIWSWIAEYTSQNKLTASLIATNAALVTWYILWKTSRNKQLIDRIPGIKDYPFVGDIFTIEKHPCDFFVQLAKLADERREHGIMKFKILEMPRISIFTPETVEVLLNNSEQLDKSVNYRYLHKFIGVGILASTGDRWRSRRKMLTPSFHFQILKDFLHVMNENTDNLVHKLKREACDSGRTYDIFPVLTLSSLDIICATAMGVHMNALNNNDSEYITAVEFIKATIGLRVRTPLHWYDFVFDKTPTGRKYNDFIKLTHAFTDKVITERREQFAAGDYESGKYQPLLDSLLQYRDENTGQGLSDEDIRAEVDTFMFEGHDTTSSGLAFTTYLLGSHPEIQKQCQEELDGIMGERREITSADLSKMTYLEWCIKESMRLFPPVPGVGRNLTKDTKFGDFVVPAGFPIMILIFVLHKDPKIYPDPEKFDPLRFKPENCVNRHPYAYLPFSAGPRNCIGMKFAMMELKVIIASILLNFNIESTQRREELRPNPGLVLQPTQGIKVKLTSRHH